MKRIIAFFKLRQHILYFLNGILFGSILLTFVSLFLLKYVNKYNNRITYYTEEYPESVQEFDKSILLTNPDMNVNSISGTKYNELILKKNEDFFTLFVNFGFSSIEVKNVINLLKDAIDFRSLHYGQKFLLEYYYQIDFVQNKNFNIEHGPIPRKSIETINIKSLSFKDSKANKIKIFRNAQNDNLLISVQEPVYTKKTRLISGTITTNLFTDVMGYQVKIQTLYQVLNEFAFVIDFQRDIRKNDKFTFLIENIVDEDGDVKSERIIYSNLILSNKKHNIYLFKDEYYDENGFSIKKGLLRSPIDGARISSGFSQSRKHPILGYSRAHLGIDFAAATGTPIYAAGDGVVTYIGLKGGYGRFVSIKHNQEYATNYAHLSRFGSIKVGQKIKQKQVIGYVGSTGLASGPHLHYEILKYNKHINPKSVKTISSKKLDKKHLDDFLEYKYYVNKILQENGIKS